MIEWLKDNISDIAGWITFAEKAFKLGKLALRLIRKIYQSKKQSNKRNLK